MRTRVALYHPIDDVILKDPLSPLLIRGARLACSQGQLCLTPLPLWRIRLSLSLGVAMSLRWKVGTTIGKVPGNIYHIIMIVSIL